MFFGQNACGERFGSVVIEDRHDGLDDNRPGVEIFVHEVHRATCILHAVFHACFCASSPGNEGSNDG